MDPIRLILVAAAALLVVIITLAFWGFLAMWTMMGGMMTPWPAGMMPTAGAGWMVLLGGALLVIGAGLLLVWGVGRVIGAGTGRAETPLSILSRRYAAGQIDREEYERVRADLLRDQGPGRDAA